MSCFPEPFSKSASPSVPDHRYHSGCPSVPEWPSHGCELHVISRNGLTAPARTCAQGSVVALMFHTHRGPCWAQQKCSCRSLAPQQPFRFVELPDGDQRTLDTAFQSGLYRNIDEERIEELRAAAKWNPSPPRRHFVAKLIMGLVVLLGCLVCTLYIHLSSH